MLTQNKTGIERGHRLGKRTVKVRVGKPGSGAPSLNSHSTLFMALSLICGMELIHKGIYPL